MYTRRMRRLAVVLLFAGCGINEVGERDVLVDASGDVTADVVKDVKEEPFVCADAGLASCTNAVQFRSPALFSQDAGTPCPAGYDTHDLVLALPSAPNCTCSCDDAGAPSCDTTLVSYHYGSVGSCNTGSGSYTLNGCTATTKSTFFGEYLEVDPPVATGGCGGGTSSAPAITSANARLCTPQCASDESVCTGKPGLGVCVSVGGNVQSCPLGYKNGPFYIGAGPSATCDTCSCAAQVDCSGSMVHDFLDPACGTGDQAFVMDGQCHALSGGQINTFNSGKIIPNVNNACKITPGAAHTAYSGNDFTLCCQ
jgi:hypothetical protein